MRPRVILAALGLASCSAGSAYACSEYGEALIFFDFKSPQLSVQAMNTLEQAAGVQRRKLEQKLPAACEQFVLIGHADTAEAMTPEVRIDLARAEAVRRALAQKGIDAGIRVEGRMGELLVPTGPGVKEPQNRTVQIKWDQPSRATGHLRCDPATKQQAFPPACVGEYGACYFELNDGTICNYNGVPDPNPQRYSVIQ